QLCHDKKIGLVIPTIDTELVKLATMSHALREQGTFAIISDLPLIQRCRDKRLTSELFKSLKINTPKVYANDEILFPCFTKPAFGSSSVGAFRLDNKEQLTETLLCEPDRMFMELIDSSLSEITVDLYYDRSGILKSAVP